VVVADVGLRLLIFGCRHVEHVLNEFVEHYGEARPHQGLEQRMPRRRNRSLPWRLGRYSAVIAWVASFTSTSAGQPDAPIGLLERDRYPRASRWPPPSRRLALPHVHGAVLQLRDWSHRGRLGSTFPARPGATLHEFRFGRRLLWPKYCL
jgi:hypothetical protein